MSATKAEGLASASRAFLLPTYPAPRVDTPPRLTAGCVGRAHFRTGIVVTSQNTTGAFCVVGNTQPTRFNAQGFFPEESSGR